MSTKLNDPATQLAAAVALAPKTLTAGAVGTGIDLADADGPVFAVVLLGNLQAGTLVGVDFDQSPTNGGWVAMGLATPSLSAGQTAYQFAVPRPARYLRCNVTVAGGSPSVEIAVLLLQQKKVV